MALLAGVVLGAVPALKVTGQRVVAGLQGGARGASGGRRQYRAQSAFVVVQVALALVLLPGTPEAQAPPPPDDRGPAQPAPVPSPPPGPATPLPTPPATREQEEREPAPEPETAAEFAVIPSIIGDPDLGLDFSRVVHGSQEYEYRRPLSVGERFVARARLASIRQRGSRVSLGEEAEEERVRPQPPR